MIKKLFGGTVTLLILGIMVLMAYGNMTAQQTRQMQAQAQLEYEQSRGQALVMEAQGQSRLDSAQAWSITSASLLPWAVLATVSILGLSLLGAMVFIHSRPAPQPRLIERQIIYLPPAQNRAEMYRLISQQQPIIGGGNQHDAHR